MKIIRNEYVSFNNALIKKYPQLPVENTGYVPQGICFIEDNLVVACYDATKEKNSVLFVLEDNIYKTIYLDSKSHCGGICYYEKTDSLFITGKGKDNKAFINRYCGKSILSLPDESKICSNKEFCVDEVGELYSTAANHSSVAFITNYENIILLGNFINYKSDKLGLIKRYRILSNGNLSVSVKRICNNFSDTQGLCIVKYSGEEYYLFSRSFGRGRNSILNVCKLVDDRFEVVSTMILPCMAQQICDCNGDIAVVFESCADKYSSNAINVSREVVVLDFGKILDSHDTFKDFCKGDKLFIDNKCIKII